MYLTIFFFLVKIYSIIFMNNTERYAILRNSDLMTITNFEEINWNRGYFREIVILIHNVGLNIIKSLKTKLIQQTVRIFGCKLLLGITPTNCKLISKSYLKEE